MSKWESQQSRWDLLVQLANNAVALILEALPRWVAAGMAKNAAAHGALLQRPQLPFYYLLFAASSSHLMQQNKLTSPKHCLILLIMWLACWPICSVPDTPDADKASDWGSKAPRLDLESVAYDLCDEIASLQVRLPTGAKGQNKGHIVNQSSRRPRCLAVVAAAGRSSRSKQCSASLCSSAAAILVGTLPGGAWLKGGQPFQVSWWFAPPTHSHSVLLTLQDYAQSNYDVKLDLTSMVACSKATNIDAFSIDGPSSLDDWEDSGAEPAQPAEPAEAAPRPAFAPAPAPAPSARRLLSV